MKKLILSTGETIRLLDSGRNTGRVILLAHGAGAPMDSDFMNQTAVGLATAGHRCVRFEFPYMAKRREDGKRRPPDRQPKLLEAFRHVLAAVADEVGAETHLFIGGKSMGGRMASLLAADTEFPLPIAGVIALGYPFHPPGKPSVLRTDHFSAMTAPFLICQGERDPFGTKDEITTLHLPQTIEIAWFPDGNHDLMPRRKSGIAPEENLNGAISAISGFMNR